MTDIERVKGFGKTLKAFQTVADQLNDIADLQATEKEAKRLTGNARSEFHNAMDKLIEANDKLKEAVSLKEAAYKERDSVDKISKENANHILSEAKRKAEDMVQNAHDAANQIRYVHETEMTNLSKNKDALEVEVDQLEEKLENLKKDYNQLKERFV